MISLEPKELSCRTDASGGGLTPAVYPLPSEGPSGTTLILLIHGYDNDVKSARDSYSTFVNHLQTEWNKAAVVLPNIYRFYWPGDKSWSIFPFLSYPLEIGPAKESAGLLLEYISELRAANGGIMDVFFIAHSLGNRLVMELLELVATGTLPTGVNVKAICMMAAAVPVSKVDVGGSLYAAATSTQSYVLWSTGDAVLHFAFPIGETAAGDSLFPTAVGRFGQPLNQWVIARQMIYGNKNHLYGHHDYWKRDETIPAIEQFLDPTVPKDPPKMTISSHMMPPPNELSQTDVAARSLPSLPAFG